MFVSQDKNLCKKKFLKPNILRRKPKPVPVKQNICVTNESPGLTPLVTSTCVKESDGQELQTSSTVVQRNTFSKTPMQILIKIQDPGCAENESKSSQDIDADVNSSIDAHSMLKDEVESFQNNEESPDESAVNIDSFLSDPGTQNLTVFHNDVSTEKEIDTSIKQKWCLNFIDDPQNIIFEQYDGSQLDGIYAEQKSDLITNMVPLSVVTSHPEESNVLQEVPAATSSPNIGIEYFTNEELKVQCDAPDCEKKFKNEKAMRNHFNKIHSTSPKVPRQVTSECPVKKIGPNGEEIPCGKLFLIREQLLKHLKEDHTPEDAIYRCEECGRRFFWASGLRAHSRSHCARPAGTVLACAWPGCGRSFRQPCRLREHTRSHTGDRPYPCRYPNCGWSFRTASKLVRHARRHTGERRHACSVCGRAFLRREHLKDHNARHHLPPHHTRALYACTHQDCQQLFSNMSSLYVHMKKVHKKQEEKNTTSEVAAMETAPVTKTTTDVGNMFVVSFMSEPPAVQTQATTVAESEDVQSKAEGEAEAEAEAVMAPAGDDWRAARTHCPWPLPRTDPLYAENEHAAAYVLEDVHVEQSEGSESNIYTVRSDLFLHGNVLSNDDSEHMPGEASNGVDAGTSGTGLDSDLSMLDAHPTIDLMQEELMYTDEAVDESSFRVFLLNGEELT